MSYPHDDGLSEEEAASLLASNGENRLPAPHHRSLLVEFARQLFHFFAIMLWVAAILAFIAGLPELAIAVKFVVIINAIFAFVQELRAQRAADRLGDLLPKSAAVIRGGQQREIDASELVVGDLVVVRSGDMISADLDVIESNGLTIDMSMLTGESMAAVSSLGDHLFAGLPSTANPITKLSEESVVIDGGAPTVPADAGDGTTAVRSENASVATSNSTTD